MDDLSFVRHRVTMESCAGYPLDCSFSVNSCILGAML